MKSGVNTDSIKPNLRWLKWSTVPHGNFRFLVFWLSLFLITQPNDLNRAEPRSPRCQHLVTDWTGTMRTLWNFGSRRNWKNTGNLILIEPPDLLLSFSFTGVTKDPQFRSTSEKKGKFQNFIKMFYRFLENCVYQLLPNS